MKKERVLKVIDKMKAMGISQLLACDPMSIYYLTGIFQDPGERFYALLVREEGMPLLFANRLFTIGEQLDMEIVWFSDTDPIMDVVAEKLKQTDRLGVDKNLQAKFLLPLMEKNAAAGFLNASLVIDEVRSRKDAEEIEKMAAVSKINDLAMEKFKKLVVPGITELAMAHQMLKIYQELGADTYSFAPLVAFGANGAEGHHEPDETVLKEGDSVLIDVGCKKDMYCADMTRTFFYGDVSQKHRELYEIVQCANETAIAKLHPGMKFSDIDAIARNVITKKGYGANFTHRLGHFIGLEVHEYGDVSSGNEKPAEPGMIFSIEPGIYLPGDVGIRIEDLVLVTETGCKRLNHYNKDLEVIK
ncbi:MAG TPA: Xaa-Pro peptidase family protein [Lachnospiraceae bacterium]|nr:Xaa-Pro peptidase family protein [Lachnospiraceae bacterium]